MSRCLGQQAHRRTEQQREDDQNTHRIESVFGTAVRRARRVGSGIGWRSSLGWVSGRRRKLVHGDDGNNQKNEYDKRDEYVDELVDAGRAVEGDVIVCGFGAELGSAEILLLPCQSSSR